MELHAIDVWESASALAAVEDLLKTEFPPDEQMPVEPLAQAAHDDTGAFRAYYDGDAFCGFAVWFWRNGYTYLLYLGVVPEARSRGIGSQILAHLKTERAGDTILLEMVSLSVDADDMPVRQRRARFYARNGFSQTGLHARDTGVVYDVLAHNGTITRDACQALFDSLPAISLESIEVFEDNA